jgi:lipopolysaccharide biosynthesis glycosyltransferase
MESPAERPVGGPIDIVTIGEESFRYGTAVLLRSAAEHCTAPGLRFFIFDFNLRPETRRRIEATVRGLPCRAEVEFLTLGEAESFREVMRIMKARGRNFLHACWFSKIAILDVLSSLAGRVYYADSDLVCALDWAGAEPLWAGAPMCAALDGPITGSGHAVEFEIEGLDPAAPYFNGGFMGFDLGAWKSEGLTAKALALTEKYTAFGEASGLRLSERGREVAAVHGTHFNDQAVFNILFYKRWACLPQEWNVQSPVGCGLLAEAAAGKRVNVHCTTNPKPWQVPESPASAYFFEVLDRTAFAGWRPNRLYWAAHLRLRTWKYHASKWLAAARGR